MARQLDSTFAAALSHSVIQPALFVSLQFKSGVVYVWNGIGDFVFGGNTYKGVGSLGMISAIMEGSEVQADGMTVSLSGFGSSPFPLGNTVIPAGVVVPYATAPGEYVAWAPPALSSPNNTGKAYARATPNGGTITLTGAIAAPTTTDNGDGSITWGGFVLPVLPSDAVVHAIYPVALYKATVSQSTLVGSGVPFSTAQTTLGQANGANIFTSTFLDSGLPAYTISAEMTYTGTGAIFQDILDVEYVGLAVYYTAASNIPSYIDDAMEDLQMGGAAKVWFGLLDGGVLISTPYLVFSGQVDQPTTDVSPESSTIMIDLENKLSNLLRPTSRRYTAADQHLRYPDDTGFNWVELLNDISLKWGTA